MYVQLLQILSFGSVLQGCYECRVQFENNADEKEEPNTMAQPAPVKIKKTVSHKSIKPVDLKQETEESIVPVQPAPIKRKIIKRIIE